MLRSFTWLSVLFWAFQIFDHHPKRKKDSIPVATYDEENQDGLGCFRKHEVAKVNEQP